MFKCLSWGKDRHWCSYEEPICLNKPAKKPIHPSCAATLWGTITSFVLWNLGLFFLNCACSFMYFKPAIFFQAMTLRRHKCRAACVSISGAESGRPGSIFIMVHKEIQPQNLSTKDVLCLHFFSMPPFLLHMHTTSVNSWFTFFNVSGLKVRLTNCQKAC